MLALPFEVLALGVHALLGWVLARSVEAYLPMLVQAIV
jgi:hypothetical protein